MATEEQIECLDKEIEYQTNYKVMGRAKGVFTEAQLIAVKTYLEMGFTGSKIAKLTGVPQDSVYKLNAGKFGRLHEVATDPELKKHWNTKRKHFIDVAYEKIELMLAAVDADKAKSANLKDTVASIATLVQQIVNMVGSTKQTVETTEEAGIVKNMADSTLDAFITSATKTLGDGGGVMLRRTIKKTVEESAGFNDASGAAASFPGEPNDRDTGEPNDRDTGEPNDRDTGEASDRDTGEPNGEAQEKATALLSTTPSAGEAAGYEFSAGDRGHPNGQDGTSEQELTRGPSESEAISGGGGSPDRCSPAQDSDAQSGSGDGDRGTHVLEEHLRPDDRAERGSNSRETEESDTFAKYKDVEGVQERAGQENSCAITPPSESELRGTDRQKFRAAVKTVSSGAGHPLDKEPIDPDSDGSGCTPVLENAGDYESKAPVSASA